MSPARDAPTPLERLRAGAGHAWQLLVKAVQGLSRHRGTQLAASISYYALFSVFPTAIVLAAGAGFFLDDAVAREDTIDFLLDELPLSEGQGRSDLETLIDGVAANSGTLGVLGLLALLISASALIGAARNSVNVVFGEEIRRGALRGKGIDVLLVLGLGVLFALSFAATLIGSLEIDLTGRVGEAIETAFTATGALLPLLLSALVFAVTYTVLPTSHPPLRDVWPGVAFAAIGYELLKRGFSLYLENFADYSAVYGSLGAVIAFMFFVYLAGLVFLLGAEMAAIWPAVRRGAFEPPPGAEEQPLRQKLREAIVGLFGRSRVEEGPLGRRRRAGREDER